MTSESNIIHFPITNAKAWKEADPKSLKKSLRDEVDIVIGDNIDKLSDFFACLNGGDAITGKADFDLYSAVIEIKKRAEPGTLLFSAKEIEIYREMKLLLRRRGFTLKKPALAAPVAPAAE